jgi:hypothetical protein
MGESVEAERVWSRHVYFVLGVELRNQIDGGGYARMLGGCWAKRMYSSERSHWRRRIFIVVRLPLRIVLQIAT